MVRTHSGCPPPPAQIVQPLVWRTVRSNSEPRRSSPVTGQLSDERLALALDVLQQWNGHLVGKGHVELSRQEGEERRRAVGNYCPFDAVEIGPPRLPVIRIAGQPKRLVGLL